MDLWYGNVPSTLGSVFVKTSAAIFRDCARKFALSPLRRNRPRRCFSHRTAGRTVFVPSGPLRRIICLARAPGDGLQCHGCGPELQARRFAAPQQLKMRLGVKSRSLTQSPPRSRSASVEASAEPVFEQTGTRSGIRSSQPRRATKAAGLDREE